MALRLITTKPQGSGGFYLNPATGKVTPDHEMVKAKEKLAVEIFNRAFEGSGLAMAFRDIDDMQEILEALLELSTKDAADSHKAAMNSYGAGYDAGYASAVRDILTRLKEDEG